MTEFDGLPVLRSTVARPFEGFNDAADASTAAVEPWAVWHARQIADLDPEDVSTSR